ncbi:MAG: hypothetical protein IT438_14640, partial [Phycisphaerales bacterium]|nr:hypothetical protein [Phycisphaerales bacterium]
MPVSQHFGPIVEAGGGAGFSADCAAALAKCGLSPDSFGSYSHVASQIDAAKQACADWDIARKSGNLAGATPPTAEQRFLSQCESGHIMQNATGQRASADRNNYCHNVIDGYDAHAAPAMPMHDGAEGRSGHGIATRMETSQATARGTPGTVCYNEADRRADQQARARAVVEDHTRRMNNAERWAAKQRDAQAQAAGGTGPGGPGTGGGGAGGAAPAGATQPKKYSPTSADLDLAAECIAAMAAWTEENMKATCAASAAANAQRAASPEHAAEASRLRQEATDARRDHRAA